MNSQINDALNEFISSNSSAMEREMENGNHGKDEPIIQDLVNYLSCPTPQPGIEDNQVVGSDKILTMHTFSGNSCNLDSADNTNINSCELENNHYSNGQTSDSKSTASYSIDSSGQDLHQQGSPFNHQSSPFNQQSSPFTQQNSPFTQQSSPLIQQNSPFTQQNSPFTQQSSPFTQQSCSFTQQSTPFSESMKQSNCTNSDFQDMTMGTTLTLNNSNGYDNNGQHQHSAQIEVGKNQLFHNGQSVQFHSPTNLDIHYHNTNIECQFSSSENNFGQFLSSSQLNTNNLGNPSGSESSLQSSSTSRGQVHYISGKDNLGFGQINVSHVSDNATNNFKVQEKMHIDEPEAGFSQVNNPTNRSQLETMLAGFVEVHMQSCSSDDFNVKSSKEVTQASTNANILDTKSNSLTVESLHQPISYSEVSSTDPSIFDMSSYKKSPLASPFTNESFQQSPALSMSPQVEPLSSEVAPSPYQVNSVDSDSTQYISWHSGSLSTNSSPYQSSQHQDSPVSIQAATNLEDSLKMSMSQTQEPFHLQSHQNFETSLCQQPSQYFHQQLSVDLNQFESNSVVTSDYCNDARINSPAGHKNCVTSPNVISAPYSSPLPAGDLGQEPQLQQQPQLGYLPSHESESLSQSSVPSNYMDYNSGQQATHTSDITSVNQTCSSHDIPAHINSNSSNLVSHVLEDSRKSSLDVNMRDYQSEENSATFPYQVIHVETSASSSSQSTFVSSVSNLPDYDRYKYNNMTPVSTNFTQSTNSVTEAQFTYNQPIIAVDTYNSAINIPFASEVCVQDSSHNFTSSNFASYPSRKINDNYPQPMQVSDSDIVNKVTEFSAETTAVISTETAMEVSSNLIEKSNNNQSSCITYEQIHMSIVNAGHILSGDLRETRISSDSSLAITDIAVAPQTLSGIQTISSQEIFQADINSVNYKIADPSLIESSKTLLHQEYTSTNGTASYTMSNNDSVMTNIDSNHHMMSSLLNSLHTLNTPSNQLMHQEEVQYNKNQSIIVPNFLENPDRLLSVINSGKQDNGSFNPANFTQAQIQTQIEATNNVSLPPSLGTNETLKNQPYSPEITNVCITSNPHTNLIADVPLVSNISDNPQVLSSNNTLPWTSNTQFLDHSDINLIENTKVSIHDLSVGQSKSSAISPKLTSAQEVNSMSSSAVLFKLAQSLSDNKNFATPIVSSEAANNAFEEKTSGITSEAHVSPSHTSNTVPNEQPQLSVSLEDLQKLLAQQKLSFSSPSLHQQQSHVPVSSPQTLVLQKHASHSLRQNQPRLLNKGTTLSNSSRSIHPNQQTQQIRDKTQLQILKPSEHIFAETLSVNSLDPVEVSTTQELQNKFSNSFNSSPFNNDEQDIKQSLHQYVQSTDHQPQPKFEFGLNETQVLQQQQQQTASNLCLQQLPSRNEQNSTQPGLVGYQLQQTNQNQGTNGLYHEQVQNSVQLDDIKQELQYLKSQHETNKDHDDDYQKKPFLHQQSLELMDRSSHDYTHMQSLLAGNTTRLTSCDPVIQPKDLPTGLSVPCNPQQPSLHLPNGLSPRNSANIHPLFLNTSPITGSFSSLLNCSLNQPSALLPAKSHPNVLSKSPPIAPLTSLTFATHACSKLFDALECKAETANSDSHIYTSFPTQNWIKLKDYKTEKKVLENLGDENSTSILAQIITDRKRCHSPLSVDLDSPADSNSEAGSSLTSPAQPEDGGTQLTLIERSADLHIRSDTMQSLDDCDNENAVFDLNSFHKWPSANEFHTSLEQNSNIPIKVAKPSINTDAHSSINAPKSPEQKFDFGGAVTSTSNFLFGKRNENMSEMYTFGTSAPTSDFQQFKDESDLYGLNSSKSATKSVGVKSSVPTQSVRPSRRQQYSLKACYPNKVGNIELKIMEQPEAQHRARYQTEGSRGAIKDASQQGFPLIKLFGYSKTTKLQVFIGDECGRVKPHGFYQACRVFGKSSTACTEQEIEGTTVVEIEMVPENDMTVKLDCIGILKLRNADVERRIGPKRARDKKKTNIRACLVLRCLVETNDKNQHLLQVVSNPIVCTQPVGQPEISRMSLSECCVRGGKSLFIIGKNFKNKGTNVLFQKLDSKEGVLWQGEAEIEQEFFQPTHLICKIPPYKDITIDSPFVSQIVINCAGKKSDPVCFVYKPG